MSPKEPTFYELLGVPPKASMQELKRAWRQAVRRYHPDHHPDDPQASRRFQQVQEAWEVLRDPAGRLQYNKAIGLGDLLWAPDEEPSRRPSSPDPSPDAGPQSDAARAAAEDMRRKIHRAWQSGFGVHSWRVGSQDSATSGTFRSGEPRRERPASPRGSAASGGSAEGPTPGQATGFGSRATGSASAADRQAPPREAGSRPFAEGSRAREGSPGSSAQSTGQDRGREGARGSGGWDPPGGSSSGESGPTAGAARGSAADPRRSAEAGGSGRGERTSSGSGSDRSSAEGTAARGFADSERFRDDAPDEGGSSGTAGPEGRGSRGAGSSASRPAGAGGGEASSEDTAFAGQKPTESAGAGSRGPMPSSEARVHPASEEVAGASPGWAEPEKLDPVWLYPLRPLLRLMRLPLLAACLCLFFLGLSLSAMVLDPPRATVPAVFAVGVAILYSLEELKGRLERRRSGA